MVFMLLLAIPMLYMVSPFHEINPLKGAVVNTEKPSFSLTSWLEGEFQEKFENYFKDHVGFRSLLVRINNQIKFTAYKKTTARGVLVGKENYLYELNYINSYQGKDFIGKKEIYDKVKDIKKIQDKLKEHNKTLLVCLAPGKGFFYPEYFPENNTIQMSKTSLDSTNYKQYVEALNRLNVSHIDFNRWFLEMKDTEGCLLYPKHGIHWSFYGMLLAADSISNYIEEKRNIQMPEIRIDEMQFSTKPKYTDYDIGDGMNLLFTLKSESLCYPTYTIVSDSNTVQPKTLVVSDSFYWSMFNIGLGRRLFSLGGFWFYNQQIYPDSYDSPIQVKDIDFTQKVMDNEVIILMATDPNLPDFGWGFIEKAKENLLD